MATWNYSISYSGDKYFKNGYTATMTIRRTSPASVDTSLYELASTSGSLTSNVSIQTYAGDVTMSFGGIGTTSTFTYNQSTHAASETMYNISSSILGIGTGGTSINVTVYHPGGSGNGIRLNNTTFYLSVEVEQSAAAYSASSISASNTSFMSDSKVNFSNDYLSVMRHKVTWSIGSYSHTQTTSTGDKNATYRLPKSWLQAVPSSTSGTINISVQTMYGSLNIGSPVTTTIKASVPSDIVPTMGTVSAEVRGAISGFPNIYIQKKNGVTLTVSSGTPGYGSSISKYTCTSSKGETCTWNSNISAFVVYPLKYSGSSKFTVKAVDSRGRTSSGVSVTINVSAYTAPAISTVSVARCDSGGNASSTGTYGKVMAKASVANITGNTMTINSTYNVQGSSVKTTAYNNMTTDISYVFGGGELNVNTSYEVTVTVTDRLGGSAENTVTLSSLVFPLHIRKGGNGVAFGQVSQIQDTVTINPNWDLNYKGVVVSPVVYSSLEPDNPRQGLIWMSQGAVKYYNGSAWVTIVS